MPIPKPIAYDAYQKLARAYAEIAPTKAENGYTEHPAIRAQIGSVAGLSILDAGCGPGIMAEHLLDEGARRVVGFDVSDAMIEQAVRRTRGAAELHVADMRERLVFATDGEFDLVTSSLAIDYVEDWRDTLAEFARVLKRPGRLVFSVQHPMGAYRWYQPESAFGVQYVEAEWRGFTEESVVVPDYYRSFEDIINPVLAAGFSLNGIQETKPIAALKDKNPDDFERYSKFPTFMVIDAQLG